MYGIRDTVTGLFYKGRGKWGTRSEAIWDSADRIRNIIGGLRNSKKNRNPVVRVSINA